MNKWKKNEWIKFEWMNKWKIDKRTNEEANLQKMNKWMTYSSNAAGLTGGIVAFKLASKASILVLTSCIKKKTVSYKYVRTRWKYMSQQRVLHRKGLRWCSFALFLVQFFSLYLRFCISCSCNFLANWDAIVRVLSIVLCGFAVSETPLCAPLNSITSASLCLRISFLDFPDFWWIRKWFIRCKYGNNSLI